MGIHGRHPLQIVAHHACTSTQTKLLPLLQIRKQGRVLQQT
jgi:hypothetical protein